MRFGRPPWVATAMRCFATLLLMGALAASAQAQTPQTTTPDTPPTTAPSAPAPGSQEQGTVPGVQNDAVTQTLVVPARPVAFIRAHANWDEAYKSLLASLDTIKAAMDTAGLKPGGHPIAVFVETDDNGFRYDAMMPLSEKPEGKTELSSDVKIGMSPSGKALKFQHRGAYDDIDSTYDLITAFLDEKGLEAQNLFIEEYLTDAKASDDSSLEVDIYVFLK